MKFDKNYNQNSRVDRARVNVKTEKWLIGEPDVDILASEVVDFVLWEDETAALVVDGTLSDVEVGEVSCSCCGGPDVVEWVEEAPSDILLLGETGCDCVVVLNSTALEVAIKVASVRL